MAEPFSYAILRLVPDIERGERLNVGVVVFCRPLDFVGARTWLDEERARALGAELDLEAARRHLAAIERVAAGAGGLDEDGEIGAELGLADELRQQLPEFAS